jgi:hypothetical protein
MSTSSLYSGVLPEISSLSPQLVELTLCDLDFRGYPPHAWPVMERFRLLRVTVTCEYLCSMIFAMPLLKNLVMKHIVGMDGENVSNILDASPSKQRAPRDLHTIVLKMKPVACASILKVLHSPPSPGQKLDVDFIHGHKYDGTFESGEIIIEALKYVMTAWGHLFVGPFLPITLTMQCEGWGRLSLFLRVGLKPHKSNQYPTLFYNHGILARFPGQIPGFRHYLRNC